MLDRRTILRALGVGVAGIAGCSGTGDPADGSTARTGTERATSTETDRPAATETNTESATRTKTARVTPTETARETTPGTGTKTASHPLRLGECGGDGRVVVRYVGDGPADPKRLRVTVDHDAADHTKELAKRQFSDAYETVTKGDTIRVEAADVDSVSLWWRPPGVESSRKREYTDLGC